jgi:hypothetical protein
MSPWPEEVSRSHGSGSRIWKSLPGSPETKKDGFEALLGGGGTRMDLPLNDRQYPTSPEISHRVTRQDYLSLKRRLAISA